MKNILRCFRGPITRVQFWAGFWVLICVTVLGLPVDWILGTHFALGNGVEVGIFGCVLSLTSICFALVLCSKRWHDRNKSGWWTLIGLVPVIGWVWLIVELGILEGTRGANRYGPDPLA